ncbi:unnamed protein product [Schistosoma margrebowiei]|uniref:Uncharacterized protein n=1 Tax=Schistosoma margrebowiei TaxID=48269 RepID=A0A183LXN8_9TREM|nr:unnamed protein product [Schistosoma margrebowiei]
MDFNTVLLSFLLMSVTRSTPSISSTFGLISAFVLFDDGCKSRHFAIGCNSKPVIKDGIDKTGYCLDLFNIITFDVKFFISPLLLLSHVFLSNPLFVNNSTVL